jgi:hypothetical protein
MSIYLFICQALAETLRRQLYQVPASKLLLESTIVSGFGGCLWDGSLASFHILYKIIQKTIFYLESSTSSLLLGFTLKFSQ